MMAKDYRLDWKGEDPNSLHKNVFAASLRRELCAALMYYIGGIGNLAMSVYRKFVVALSTAFLFSLVTNFSASASLLITIDKSKQRMIVALDDLPIYDWPVSTGQAGYDTPTGEFKPFRMEAEHYSQEWDDAPMPHSIFFTPIGHAIHGSPYVKRLGTRVSHGCVRLAPDNASTLYAMVEKAGLRNTTVVVRGGGFFDSDEPDTTPSRWTRKAGPVRDFWDLFR